MRKDSYEFQQLFHYLDDLKCSLLVVQDDVKQIKDKTLSMYEEVRNENYINNIEKAFNDVRDVVIEDYESR